MNSSEARIIAQKVAQREMRGWSTSGKIYTKRPAQGISIQSQMSKAGVFTIQFGVQPPSTNFYAPRAEVAWSVEGNTVRRTVDVVDGLSFTGVGTNPQARVYDSVPSAIGNAGIPYEISVNIAAGARPSQNQPPTRRPDTYQIGINPVQDYFREVTLPAAQQISFPVPKNSGCISAFLNVTALANVLTEADYYIRMSDVLGGQLRSFYNREVFVPLAPGTERITVVSLTYQCQVGCTFGVDG